MILLSNFGARMDCTEQGQEASFIHSELCQQSRLGTTMLTSCLFGSSWIETDCEGGRGNLNCTIPIRLTQASMASDLRIASTMCFSMFSSKQFN